MIDTIIKIKDQNDIVYACICQNDKTREIEIYKMQKIRALDEIEKIIQEAKKDINFKEIQNEKK